MKLIDLTQGQVTKVDDEDFEYLNQWKWYALWSPITQSYYAVRNEGIIPFRKTIRMHRVIMKTPMKLLCDHEDHDTLNNQKYNLRNATHSQNAMNMKLSSKNQLGEKNIRINGNKFQVRVSVDKIIYGKFHDTLEDAIKERDELTEMHHGKFKYTGGNQ